MSIFTDKVEVTIEVFMEDFSLIENSFDVCLINFVEELKRYEYLNVVLNWEKCNFMVKEGIVLDHRISKKFIEVYRAKFEVIERLPPPNFVKGVRSFLGDTFGELKEKLVSATISISPNWSEPFELMCDSSGVALGVLLG
ncbi:uncharacterized protein [Solanum lycopersicum]|uniref:uncharacterized protein n=1 Tax=Solanum lycopersicum TaxID=4081 RepID=UPI000532CDE8|nr:uncharacterized protein LOC104649786 [Solanum lycopersicum]